VRAPAQPGVPGLTGRKTVVRSFVLIQQTKVATRQLLKVSIAEQTVLTTLTVNIMNC